MYAVIRSNINDPDDIAVIFYGNLIACQNYLAKAVNNYRHFGYEVTASGNVANTFRAKHPSGILEELYVDEVFDPEEEKE